MDATTCRRDLSKDPAAPNYCGKPIKKPNGFDWCQACMEIVPIPGWGEKK